MYWYMLSRSCSWCEINGWIAGSALTSPRACCPAPASALTPESAWSSASQSSASPHNDHVVADHPLTAAIGTAPGLASMVAEAVADAGHRRRRRRLAGDLHRDDRASRREALEGARRARAVITRSWRARPATEPVPWSRGSRPATPRWSRSRPSSRTGSGLCPPRSAGQPDPCPGTVLSPAIAGRSGIEKRRSVIRS